MAAWKFMISNTAAETADIILTGEADRERYKQFINRVLCVVEELHHKDLVLF